MSLGPRDGKARVLVVVGTRPEAIKMAPVVAALAEHAEEIETRLVLTGQHTDLVDQVLQAFDLRPDHELGLMREDQTLYDVVHGALDGLRGVMQAGRPDLVLVQGDTATVFVGALVGFFEGIAVGHVEAGLRSGDRGAPFPEEMLRRLTDVLADIHFAPTGAARDALVAEGTEPSRVFVTGNTVVDALLRIAAADRPAKDARLRGVLSDPGQRLVLLTAHRREAFGAPLESVFSAVRALADQLPDVRVLYPVHPNPRVREPAYRLLGDHPRVLLTDPLDYPDLVLALRRAHLVLTDSGGIQEEAPTFGTPVLVLREVTERPEPIELGLSEKVGFDREAILARSLAVLERGPAAGRGHRPNPFGDGRAGARIADIVASRLLDRPRRTGDWVG